MTTEEQLHPTKLTYAFERLRNEHVLLCDSIQELELAAKRLCKQEEMEAYVSQLSALREQTLNLIAELESHSIWEDRELFPLLTEYFRLPSRPDTTTSLWMLEHEHELANTFFRYFLEEAERQVTEGRRMNGVRVTDLLLQACRLVKEHLETEEETVFPLEEELLAGSEADIA